MDPEYILESSDTKHPARKPGENLLSKPLDLQESSEPNGLCAYR